MKQLSSSIGHTLAESVLGRHRTSSSRRGTGAPARNATRASAHPSRSATATKPRPPLASGVDAAASGSVEPSRSLPLRADPRRPAEAARSAPPHRSPAATPPPARHGPASQRPTAARCAGIRRPLDVVRPRRRLRRPGPRRSATARRASCPTGIGDRPTGDSDQGCSSSTSKPGLTANSAPREPAYAASGASCQGYGYTLAPLADGDVDGRREP